MTVNCKFIKRDARRDSDSYGKCGMRKVVAAILGVNIRITTHNHVRSRDNIHVELLKMNKNNYVIKRHKRYNSNSYGT